MDRVGQFVHATGRVSHYLMTDDPFERTVPRSDETVILHQYTSMIRVMEFNAV